MQHDGAWCREDPEARFELRACPLRKSALVHLLGWFLRLRARVALLPAWPGRGPHATLSVTAKYGCLGSLGPCGRDGRLYHSDSPGVHLSEVAVSDTGPARGTLPAATTKVSPKK